MQIPIKQAMEQPKRRIVSLVLVLLLILTAATTAALCSGLLTIADRSDLTIELIPKNDAEAVRVMPLSAAGAEGAVLHRLSGDPLFTVEDDVQTWDTDTQVDIFKIAYENGENEIIVAGNGDKVIAPGAENTYSFRLKNNGSGTADYKVTVEAWIEGYTGGSLPVEVRFNSLRSGWLVGTGEQWQPILTLNGVEDTGILGQNSSATYDLHWRWPFEQDLNGDGDVSDGDALDTMLGNLAVEQDVTLTIRITTLCNYHTVEMPPVYEPVPGWLNGVDHFAYIYGYPDGTVRPNANITRGEVAAIFYRLLWPEIREQYYTETNDYPDVPDDKWCCVEISTLTKLGILEGYPDGTFGPDDTITRAEFATVCARFSQRTSSEKTELKDIKKHWARDKIIICEDNNWIIGYEDQTFRPENDITRAEAVTIVNRMLHRLPEQVSDLLEDMIRWPDNQDPEAWYYLAIQEASNGHGYRRLTGTREKWIYLRNAESF